MTLDEEIAAAEKNINWCQQMASATDGNLRACSNAAEQAKRDLAAAESRLAELRAKKAAEAKTYGEKAAEKLFKMSPNAGYAGSVMVGDNETHSVQPQESGIYFHLRILRRCAAAAIDAARADMREECVKAVEDMRHHLESLSRLTDAGYSIARQRAVEIIRELK